MIKVLIVDDEEGQRSGLIRHVDWNAYEMVVTGEAESARQALELAADNPPDLMISDIRMPGADGLELCRSMRELNHALRIIMVSGYEKFEYAKTAIDIGIDAYLVKPIDFSQLAEVLDQVKHSFFSHLQKQEEDSQLREKLREFLPFARQNFLHELIYGHAGTEEDIRKRSRYLQMFEMEVSHAVLIVNRDSSERLPSASEENRELEHLKIRKIAQHALGDILEEVHTSRGDMILIVRCPVQSSPNRILEQRLERFHQEVENELGCKINIGIGPAVESLQEIVDSFRLAQRAIQQRLLIGSGQIIYWYDIGEKKIWPGSGVEIERSVKDILKSLQQGDGGSIDETFRLIIHKLIESDSITETETGCICMELVSSAIRIIGEMSESLRQDFDSEKELWKRLLSCNGTLQMLQETKKILIQFCDLIAERKNSRHRSIIQIALEYIGEHYREDISLQDAAEKVYLSPSYLGTLLRVELKQSFTEYLTRLRIEKAKELLKDPQYKLYEISEHVGYQNPAYFSNIFKRYTGLSPKDFRNS